MRIDAHSDRRDVEVELFLGNLDPDFGPVELYAERESMAALPLREEIISTQTRPNAARGRVYRAETRCPLHVRRATPAPQVIPKRSGVTVPLESAHILWQR